MNSCLYQEKTKAKTSAPQKHQACRAKSTCFSSTSHVALYVVAPPSLCTSPFRRHFVHCRTTHDTSPRSSCLRLRPPFLHLTDHRSPIMLPIMQVTSSSLKYQQNATAYGGTLRKKRAGRIGPRALSKNYSMHLVVRSSQARNEWSFFHKKNRLKIHAIIKKHAQKNKIQVISMANVGNHIHLHIRLLEAKYRKSYCRFIRSFTGEIALWITRIARDTAPERNTARIARNVTPIARRTIQNKKKFWDHRPFSRLIIGKKQFLTIKDYMQVNILEGQGWHRINARLFIARQKDLLLNTS